MESTHRDAGRREWIAVVVLGALGLLAFAKIGQNVLAHESIPFDTAIRAWVATHTSSGLFVFFFWVTTLGQTRAMYGLSIAVSLFLWYREKGNVAANVLIAPALAVAVYESVKRLYGRARPAGYGHVPEGFSFPSAHATAAAAVCCTLAYVLWREGLFGRSAALLLGVIVPLLVGVSRVYLDAHWATDVLGGWSAGLFIAALSAGLYNRARIGRGVAVHTQTPS
jgi:undecaprenyl-diphosphatase